MDHCRTRTLSLANAIAVVLLCGTVVASAQEVGTVAAVEGQAEIGDGATWTPAAVGAPVAVANTVKTGRPGRVQLVFQDDSVLTVSADSQIVIDEHLFDPNAKRARSVLNLLQGKVTAIVSDYYRRVGATYEINTSTAVAGVRGTEFSVRYDPERDLTEVIGISGVVSVNSAVDPTGPATLITASEVTTIPAGQLPTAPRKLEESIFRQQLEGITFIGGGRLESLTGSHPLVTGSAVLPPDQAGGLVVAGGTNGLGGPRSVGIGSPDASSLLGGSPAATVRTGPLDIEFGRRR